MSEEKKVRERDLLDNQADLLRTMLRDSGLKYREDGDTGGHTLVAFQVRSDTDSFYGSYTIQAEWKVVDANSWHTRRSKTEPAVRVEGYPHGNERRVNRTYKSGDLERNARKAIKTLQDLVMNDQAYRARERKADEAHKKLVKIQEQEIGKTVDGVDVSRYNDGTYRIKSRYSFKLTLEQTKQLLSWLGEVQS